MKNEKASWAMVSGVGKGSEGNLQAMPRFESKNGSSWEQLRADHLRPCYLLGSQLLSGKTKAVSPPRSFEPISF